MTTITTPTLICRPVLICCQLLVLGAGSSQSATTIFNNGPIITNPGEGYEGANVSIAPAVLNYTAGFIMNKTTGYRLADDFQVPAGETWNLTAVKLYGYQTGSSTISTFTGLYARIWEGRPGDLGANPVWGNDGANILTGSVFSGTYRVQENQSITNNTRPVMELSGVVSTSLGAGTYWLEWTTTGSSASGPFNPPVSIVGQPATGNARQLTPTGWTDVRMGVYPPQYPQDFPFLLEGTVVPEPSQWAMMGMTLLGAAGVVLRRYRWSATR